MSTTLLPYTSITLRQAVARRSTSVVGNSVIPIIIVVAIAVLLLLATSIVAAAIILCATRGGVLDTVVNLDAWTVKVVCHKL